MIQSKTLKGLAAIVLTAFLAGSSHAAFTSVTKTALSAGATLTGAGTVSFDAVIADRLTHAAATSLTWATHVTPAPGAGFLLADQYIQLNTTITVATGGGIQIYTDNTNAAATPKYVGPVNATSPTPAGLVATNGLSKLPTAWAIQTSPITAPTAGNPNNITTFSNWFFHEDKAQVANNQNATLFVNADPFITAYGAGLGLHFGQGPTQFGGFNAIDTNYIYTEADFTAATTPNTYATNELIVEAFTD
jgi:hypothetical protein